MATRRCFKSSPRRFAALKIDQILLQVSSDYSCYKLFGVDVFLDSDLKPWLLELNNFPSLEPDTLDRWASL